MLRENLEKFMKAFKKLFGSNRWCTAYRITDFSDINFSLNKEPFFLVAPPKGCWIADPFLFKTSGKILIFCECTNPKKSKSFIAFKEIYPKEEKQWYLAYEFSGHTSYPCIFNYENGLFMIPETTFDKTVVVLKFNVLTKKWETYSTLAENINAPDTTFFIRNKKPCLFLYEIQNREYRTLHYIELDNELRRIESDSVIKSYDCPDGRPGGNCIFDKNDSYRVVQKGIKLYGEQLDFYRFSFNDNNYVENLEFSVRPNDIRTHVKLKVLGIHTYNRVENVEVIDLFVEKNDVFRPIKIFFKKLNLFGFGYYDKNQKYIYKKYFSKTDIKI